MAFLIDVGRLTRPDKGRGLRIPVRDVLLDVRHQRLHGIEEPRRTDVRVRMVNHASTMLSQDAPVGVK